MKLDELHILQRNSRLVGQVEHFSGGRKTIGSGLVNFSAPSRSQQDRFRPHKMEFSGGQVIRHQPGTYSPVKDQRENIVLRIKFYPMAQALVEKGVEDDPPGVVGGVARPFHGLLPIFPGVAAEVPLGNLPLRGTAERNAHMFQLIDPPGSILNHDLHDILVAEVITPLDRIEEMPFPVIFFLVAQGRGDSSLGSAGMGTSGVHFANDCYIGLVRAFHSRSQPGQPSSHDDNVMLRNHNSRLSPAMDLQAFSFSLPYFYDKYKAFNYSNAFCGRASHRAFGHFPHAPSFVPPLFSSRLVIFCPFIPHSSSLTVLSFVSNHSPLTTYALGYFLTLTEFSVMIR